MRQPLMTAVVGLARGCNPWASVVFFGAYLCSDQLHASQDWTSESNQMVIDGSTTIEIAVFLISSLTFHAWN